MPLENACKDAAYAIYSLKYFPELDGVMKEVSRVLKPGGRFLIYDLIKTEKYDEKNETHVEIVQGLEYACGMPSLHTREDMVTAAERYGLTFEEEEDLSVTNGSPFHYCFSHSPLFIKPYKCSPKARILPQGFLKFNDVFLSGTVQKIVDGGRLGILSGSKIFVFKKK
ncbi:hypothetical protein OESDEN_24781 [Oesophagostomum dentatum]|uniref:SAM-dependent methyltransferase Erg6/SMT-type domain-containing protein n=1 Tax=Oesophagostomum dentatum TaxID=61180 RepID=A0A0B1RRB1_OESDE|nr:hypothetical protein OESDEN_24781 [Oesophagostomum dentatum]